MQWAEAGRLRAGDLVTWDAPHGFVALGPSLSTRRITPSDSLLVIAVGVENFSLLPIWIMFPDGFAFWLYLENDTIKYLRCIARFNHTLS